MVEKEYVAKYFSIGDSVMCTHDSHRGESGIVSNYDLMNCVVTVLNPIKGTEFKCKANYLTDISSNLSHPNVKNTIKDIENIPEQMGRKKIESQSSYRIGDLVLLITGSVGMVITCHHGTNKLDMLTTSGDTISVNIGSIKEKRKPDRLEGLDHYGNELKCGMTVKTRNDNQADQKYIVIGIWDDVAFLKSQVYMGINSEKIKVIKCCNIITISGTTDTFSMGNKEQVGFSGTVNNRPKLQTNKHPNVGKSVRVIGMSKHKGKIGVIQAVNGNRVHLRLISSPITIVIETRFIQLLDQEGSRTEEIPINLPTWARIGVCVQITASGSYFGSIGTIIKIDKSQKNKGKCIVSLGNTSVPLIPALLRPQRPSIVGYDKGILLNEDKDHEAIGIYQGMVGENTLNLELGYKNISCNAECVWKYNSLT